MIDGYAIPDGSGGFYTFASIVFTSANSDQLSGPCTGHAVTTENGDHVSFTECVIAGGTGRFEGASGHFTATTLTFNLHVVGTRLIGEIQGTDDGVLNLNRA